MRRAVANPHPSIRPRLRLGLLGMLVVIPLNDYLEHSGHYPFIEEPEGFWPAVGDFLNNARG
ncbi:MAG: hypothetical protein MAG451_00700 [Anaerolineales bacterium]|nr:hypothetical protein [Anaerolineales bacterium]